MRTDATMIRVAVLIQGAACNAEWMAKSLEGLSDDANIIRLVILIQGAVCDAEWMASFEGQMHLM